MKKDIIIVLPSTRSSSSWKPTHELLVRKRGSISSLTVTRLISHMIQSSTGHAVSSRAGRLITKQKRTHACFDYFSDITCRYSLQRHRDKRLREHPSIAGHRTVQRVKSDNAMDRRTTVGIVVSEESMSHSILSMNDYCPVRKAARTNSFTSASSLIVMRSSSQMLINVRITSFEAVEPLIQAEDLLLRLASRLHAAVGCRLVQQPSGEYMIMNGKEKNTRTSASSILWNERVSPWTFSILHESLLSRGSYICKSNRLDRWR